MKHELQRFHILCILVLSGLQFSSPAQANPLTTYVQAKDSHLAWHTAGQSLSGGMRVTRIQMVSQAWRGELWHHHLLIVTPKTLTHPDQAFLMVAGDGEGNAYINDLVTLAERGGTLAAVIMNVPNQPLYEGRREDELIAYTFNQYLLSGDESWPLLFPMVKSVARAMDVVQAFAGKSGAGRIKQFVVSGASKRGWTTWLSAAVDARIKAIAPKVIDVLNMQPQLQWSEQVYGQQSVKIRDYTELNLHRKQNSPAMQKLRSWVDPYEYRDLFTMPKLLLLGTNDPYWTVDSLRHYWHELPEPKLIYQTPNAGHNLNGGQESLKTLAAFYEMVVRDQPLPKLSWQFAYQNNQQVELKLQSSLKADRATLWSAFSEDRDFRPDHWESQALDVAGDSQLISTGLARPEQGYKAFMLELTLQTPQGHPYKLSTEARVIPDTTPCYCWRHDATQNTDN